jgi:hypothetical protein
VSELLYTSIIPMIFALDIELRVPVLWWVLEYVRCVLARGRLDDSSHGISLSHLQPSKVCT